MNSFESRINLNVPLDTLSKVVCKNYKLGDFVDNNLIEIGYEDYNYILSTKKGKFVVKVFSNFRADDDCQNLADRATVPSENGFSSPKIYKANGKNLFKTKINDTDFRLLVMEYIDGKDFYSLGILPNLEELKIIGQQLAKLNKIQFKPPFIYDRWAIVNFAKEYELNKGLLNKEDNKKINEIVKQLNSCDFSKLKYGFVHGDIIETNVMKDSHGKLYYIDFSVSNYLPRIVDLAITICDLCLDLNNMKLSKIRTQTFVEAYESIDKLSEYEKECLNIFIKAHQATTILNATREKIIEKNDSEENNTFLEKGKIGLELVSKHNLMGGKNEISK